MMHPTMVATLAAEHRADLLRSAEIRRRSAVPALHERRHAAVRAADGLSRAVTALRNRVAATTEPQAGLCCA